MSDYEHGGVVTPRTPQPFYSAGFNTHSGKRMHIRTNADTVELDTEQINSLNKAETQLLQDILGEALDFINQREEA